MSETRTDSGDDLSLGGDDELIAAVRAGDGSAYGTLFARHVSAATRLAVQLAGRSEADDLVSEAFTKVLLVLRRGEGPDLAFRAYLLTAIRRLHIDRLRAQKKLQTTDDLTPYDEGVPFTDTAVEDFEGDAAARAFHSLPERWQMVLWHLEVEGQRPAEVAPLLGVKANAVSALAYRAREGLREAYLNMHTPDDLPDEECRWVHEHLGGYVRNTQSERDTRRVREHLDVCVVCSKSYLELASVNSEIRLLIGPLVLGGAATEYLGTGKSGSGPGVGALFGRARDLVALHAKTAAVATIGTTVAAVTITTALVTHNAQPDRAADGNTGRGTTTSQSPGLPSGGTTPTKVRDKATDGATAGATASPSVRVRGTSPAAKPTPKKKSARSGRASARAPRASGSGRRANIAVTAGRRGTSGKMTNGRWFVTGVPTGKAVQLTISAPISVVLASGECLVVGNDLSCRVGNGDGSFQAMNSSGSPQQVMIRVRPAPGFDDPRLANNVAALTAD